MLAAARTTPWITEEDAANASRYVVTKAGKCLIKRAPGPGDMWVNAASNSTFHVLTPNCRTNFCGVIVIDAGPKCEVSFRGLPLRSVLKIADGTVPGRPSSCTGSDSR